MERLFSKPFLEGKGYLVIPIIVRAWPNCHGLTCRGWGTVLSKSLQAVSGEAWRRCGKAVSQEVRLMVDILALVFSACVEKEMKAITDENF